MYKFLRTGSVIDKTHSGRPRTSPEIIQGIQDTIERSPRSSTRRLNREIGVSQSTKWRFLHFTLKKRANRMQAMHALEEEDRASCETMWHDLLDSVDHENLMDNIFFSDEANFHVCGMINRHNSRIWSDEQPHATLES